MTAEELNQLQTMFAGMLNTALKNFEIDLIERINTPQKPWISKRQAYQRYGRTTVDNWIEMQVVRFVMRANRIEINVADLEKQNFKKQLIKRVNNKAIKA